MLLEGPMKQDMFSTLLRCHVIGINREADTVPYG